MNEYKSNFDKLLLRSSSNNFQNRVLLIAFFSCLRIFGSIISFVVVTRPAGFCPPAPSPASLFNASLLTLANNFSDVAILSAAEHDSSNISISYNASLGNCTMIPSMQTVVTEWPVSAGKVQIRIYEAFIFLFLGTGSGIFAWIADLNGRYMAMVTACLVDVITSLLAAFSRYYGFWVIMRLSSYFTIGGQLILLQTYLNEFLPQINKAAYRCMVVLFSVLSYAYIGIISHNLHSWRVLEVIALIPCLINGILVLFFFFSSPLWKYHQCDDKKAKTIVQQILNINKYVAPQESVNFLFLNCPRDPRKWKVLEIFEDIKLLQRTVSVIFVWYAFALFYFHLTLETDHFVTGDLHLSLVLMTVVDALAGVITLSINRFLHRRKALMLYCVVSIICILIAAIVGEVAHYEKGVNMAYFLMARLFSLCGFLQTIPFVRNIFVHRLRGIGMLFSWIMCTYLVGITMLICAPIKTTAEVAFHIVAVGVAFVVAFFMPRILGSQSVPMTTPHKPESQDHCAEQAAGLLTLQTVVSDGSSMVDASHQQQRKVTLHQARKAPIAQFDEDII